jgi:hypothetical protein
MKTRTVILFLGKTVFTARVLRNLGELCTANFEEIYFCYNQHQQIYEDLEREIPNIIFSPELPNLSVLQSGGHKLLILDDKMDEMTKGDDLQKLFTQYSHHWLVSCIHIVQNLYAPNLRTARINAKYMVLFRSPADKLQVSNLAKTMFPGNSKYLLDSFFDATNQKFGYLFVDLTQQCGDNHRLRTNIFPTESEVVYIPKKGK